MNHDNAPLWALVSIVMMLCATAIMVTYLITG